MQVEHADSRLHLHVLPTSNLDRLTNALICSTPADIARHGVFDIAVSRFRFLLQQSGRLHDLTALTVAALRNLDLLPGPLHRMSAVFAQTFNSRDLFIRGGAHRCPAAS